MRHANGGLISVLSAEAESGREKEPLSSARLHGAGILRTWECISAHDAPVLPAATCHPSCLRTLPPPSYEYPSSN